jgi:hypothetical protein
MTRKPSAGLGIDLGIDNFIRDLTNTPPTVLPIAETPKQMTRLQARKPSNLFVQTSITAPTKIEKKQQRPKNRRSRTEPAALPKSTSKESQLSVGTDILGPLSAGAKGLGLELGSLTVPKKSRENPFPERARISALPMPLAIRKVSAPEQGREEAKKNDRRVYSPYPHAAINALKAKESKIEDSPSSIYSQPSPCPPSPPYRNADLPITPPKQRRPSAATHAYPTPPSSSSRKSSASSSHGHILTRTAGATPPNWPLPPHPNGAYKWAKVEKVVPPCATTTETQGRGRKMSYGFMPPPAKGDAARPEAPVIVSPVRREAPGIRLVAPSPMVADWKGGEEDEGVDFGVSEGGLGLGLGLQRREDRDVSPRIPSLRLSGGFECMI